MMRIRECECNHSFTMSFDEFESTFLEDDTVVFSEGYEHFATVTLPKGVIVQEFDVFWESEAERVEFIAWLGELGF